MKKLISVQIGIIISFLSLNAQSLEVEGYIDVSANSSPTIFFSEQNQFIGYLGPYLGDFTLRSYGTDLKLRPGTNSVVIDPPSGDDAILQSNPEQAGGDLFLESNDAVVVRIDKNNNGQGNFFVWDDNATTLFQVTQAGNVYVGNSLVHSSDRNRKEKIDPINYTDILEALKDMPVYEWQFKKDTRRHIGPMAQDFHKAFQLGDDDKVIAAIDADGIAMAAIKAQQEIIDRQEEKLNFQKSEIIILKEQLLEIKARMIKIDKKLEETKFVPVDAE